MEIDGIGRRVAYWRSRRHITQVDFGAMVGKSRRWVQDLEGGKRQSDPRLSVLEATATALQIPIEALFSDAPVSTRECMDAAEVAAIRDIMYAPAVIMGMLADGTEPVSVDALRRAAAYGWDAFQATHYSAVGRTLPALIRDAHRVAATADGDDQRAANSHLSAAYQLASATLIKFGDATLAWHAADRGIAAAEKSGDPVVIASAARRLSDSLLTQGQGAAGVALSVAVAQRLEPDLASGASALSVLGMLYLKAAAAAAVQDDHRLVMDLLTEAAHVANRLGRDGNAEWTAFGPTNVELYRVWALVQRGDGAAAIAAADKIPPPALASLPRERRANLLVDVAHGCAQAGRRDEALKALLSAEQLAAQEVRCRPASSGLVRQLLARAVPSPCWDLRQLAGRCGVSA